MTYKYPILMNLVSEIAGRSLSEIELLRIEVVCLGIEKNELKRYMEMTENVFGEAPTKESK